MRKHLLSLLLLTVLGCEEDPQESLVADEASPAPGSEVRGIDSFPELRRNLEFYDLDNNSLTNPEDHNIILVCKKGRSFCKSACVSLYYPGVERFSVFKSYYLDGDKCVAHILQYPNGFDIPKYFYYLGRYQQRGPNYCMIDTENPDFAGRAYFDEVRVLEGEVSPHPATHRLYYIHKIFDLSGNFLKDIFMLSWNPPVQWEYQDREINRTSITVGLQAGFACVRQDQIQ